MNVENGGPSMKDLGLNPDGSIKQREGWNVASPAQAQESIDWIDNFAAKNPKYFPNDRQEIKDLNVASQAVSPVILSSEESKIDHVSPDNSNHQENKSKYIARQPINVLRTNGQMESDWAIAYVDDKNGRAIVYKDDNGRGITKEVSFTDLDEWNAEAPQLIEQKVTFNQGQKVNVLRTNGRMESDWKIARKDSQGNIVVTKPDPDTIGINLEKIIPRSLLEEWNPVSRENINMQN
jgi:hypothetical protein